MRLNPRWTSFVLALALLLTAIGFTALAETAETGASGLTRDVLVLFTSDVHCGVDQNFGYAGLQAVRDAAAVNNHVLLVDDGDSIQGEPIGIMTRGQANIELMNALKYDLASPGNHEFDYGMERFFELVEMAEYPYISCNFRKNGELVFDPYVIKEFDGVKIAFVGADTPETLTSSTPRYFQDENGDYIYSFSQGGDGTDFYATVQKAIDDARAEGAEYVFLVAHLGNEAGCRPYTYADVIEHTTGLDAVLDGHSHDTDKVVMKNAEGRNVIRQACGTKMSSIGWLRISAADGSVDTGLYTWANDVPAPVLLGIDNELSRLVEEKTSDIYAQLAEVIGTSNVELSIYDPEAVDDSGKPVRIVRFAETSLGDLCVDALRAATGAQIGLINGGVFRGRIEKGEVTLKDAMGVLPFGNRYTMIEATGQQILDALEWGARVVPEENNAFLQCSGLTYEIDVSVKSGCFSDENGLLAGVEGDRRVRNVLVDGEPLDADATYTVAGMSYSLIDHGDGQTAFDGAKVLFESEDADYQALARYIKDTLGGVIGEGYENPYGQERIVAVGEAAQSAEEGTETAEAPEGVVPVTWKVTPEHPMIDTDEARALYQQILAKDYPTMEELLANPVVQQLDDLSEYYYQLYGDTDQIDTPEREQLRADIIKRFLEMGSARTDSVNNDGGRHYVYDGPLNRDFQMELVLGLPASGKSTAVVDPDSEAMGAFVLDVDVIKAMIPEFIESHGAASGSIHMEGVGIFQRSFEEFLTGSMKGVNVILPAVGGNLEQICQNYIYPFEEAGYTVKVKYRDAEPNEAAARVVMRELGGGQLIHSSVAFNFGDGPKNVFNALKEMTSASGEPYVDGEESDELSDAA